MVSQIHWHFNRLGTVCACYDFSMKYAKLNSVYGTLQKVY